ncbi:MAG: hypothetical protein EOO65_05155 [Methanosarcinales archaeon]|nr:MAG: hypothetical protein EOO65_05155 [Methanosarcinales archaeon]
MTAASKFDDILRKAMRSDWSVDVMAELRRTYFVCLGRGTAKPGVGAAAPTPGGADASDDAASLGVPLMRMDVEDVLRQLKSTLTSFQREEKDMNVHVVADLVDHVACIDRALTHTGGSALLIGRSGAGRRSAVSLVSHMHRMAFMTPSVGKQYNYRTFATDLKAALAAAGVEGEHVVFYIEDFHFADTAVLESVNSLLASGDGVFACTVTRAHVLRRVLLARPPRFFMLPFTFALPRHCSAGLVHGRRAGAVARPAEEEHGRRGLSIQDSLRVLCAPHPHVPARVHWHGPVPSRVFGTL